MSAPKGSLELTSLPAILRPLVRDRKTGVLRLTRGPVTKTIYVSGGRVIFATSTDPDDRLGEMLLTKGVITYRALEESVLSLKAGKRQGTILVEGNVAKEEDYLVAPGEHRGGPITGGRKIKVKEGDVVSIPPYAWHIGYGDPGVPLTYLMFHIHTRQTIP